MSTALRPRAAASSTPSLRQAGRRARFWVGFAAVALVIVIVAIAVRGGGDPAAGSPLAADSAAPGGSRALVQVLQRHGVSVKTAATLSEARAAVTAAGAADATVLLADPSNYLSRAQLRSVAELGAAVVIVQPSFAALEALAPTVSAAGAAKKSSDLPTRCEVPAAVRAGSITAPGQAYRVAGAGSTSGTADVVGCFPTSDGAYAYVHTRNAQSGSSVDVLGSTKVLSNDGIDRAGNAALALNLLGGTHTLVWYLPTIADVAATGPPSLGALTPGWVTAVMVLLLVAALAAAIWRGRRFGPLVVENLPVVVRAEETMEGRARLYQRSSARLRALDALRVGAVARLARLAGLARTASVIEVSDAVAALIGGDPATVRGILLGTVPHSDAELLRASDRLAELETAVMRRTRPTASPTPQNSPPRSNEGE
ncbi:DUF4350 domain-containing protein [Leifsonia sp. Root112D2]|uniref:DUF4350 domain-containing protein n=1 Tax=Leifsonia sp. Root112D2 TaxID=1736426 RepID=UPI0009E8AD53|nr:DUF4350 domain-containing protein [Leifsonia sp. Root112D2]